MKLDLLNILVCPECKNELNPEVFAKEADGEIVDGLLICRQPQHWYAVVSGIPRMFAGSYRGIAYRQYDGFFAKYSRYLSGFADGEYERAGIDFKLGEVAKSFGFEWTKFSDYSLDNLEELMHPFSLNDFNGKIGLDAGCGAGRHVARCAGHAGTIVGVDLSLAVEEAYKKTRHLKNVHIVQADILKMPFRDQTFDFVYSLGVLHHLPTPQKGFNSLVDLLKRKGEIYLWVYKRSLRKIVLDPIRRLTSKLPPRILLFIVNVISCFGYFCVIVPYRFLSKIKGIAKITPSHIREYSRYDFKVYRTDWFDRLSAPIAYNYSVGDILGWCEGKEMTAVKVKAIKDFWCYGHGVKG